MSIKTLFLTPYPYQEAPSQRFRFEQYFHILEANGVTISTRPFFSEKGWVRLYRGNVFSLLFFTAIGFLKRVLHLLQSISADFVFIHREASPIGPPIFEWVLAKILRKKIIYDFDDAIWLEDPNEMRTLKSKLKWKSKVASICKWSYKVSVGNQYLADFASQYNDNVVINPTTIDTEGLHNPLSLNKGMPEQVRQGNQGQAGQGPEKIVIGWTGTHSTLQYLNPIIPIIQQLEEKYDFEFLVIANKNPNYGLKSFKFLSWNKETEIKDLMRIDIGIMPLSDDEWSYGKCGFKLLQYMALAKPVLASSVGINSNIISAGINGYLCNNQEEWYSHLVQLTTDPMRRQKFGYNGRKRVVKDYSILSNQTNFLSLFE